MKTIDDLAPTLSIAGVWQPVASKYVTKTFSGGLANTFAGVLPLGASGAEGMVLTGWAYDPGATKTTPVDISILAQQADGTMKLETSQYISNPTTNGGGSVEIADFNGKGLSIFLAAHNETPFIATPSTVYLANGSGGFTRTVLSDKVMAHDATLAYIDGVPIVLTVTFQPGDADPMYSWNGTGFTETKVGLTGGGAPPPPEDGFPGADIDGMSVAAADFGGDGQTELVFGEVTYGPGYQYEPNNAGTFVMYKFSNDALAGSPKFIGTPYFNGKSAYSGYTSPIGSAKPTHTYRIWVDDFNHDGRPDVLGGESIWEGGVAGAPVSMLQMFQNEGNLDFRDVTGSLNARYDVKTSEIDYNMQMVDLDHSGIETYLSGAVSFDPQTQNNFVIINDGAGDLYYAMHSVFSQMTTNVIGYLKQKMPAYYFDSNYVPKFEAYLAKDGLLNFEAIVDATVQVNGIWTSRYVFVNVPTQINIDDYVTTPMTVKNRNGSHLIRTFAGTNKIYSGNDGGYCNVNGGSGHTTVIYSGPRCDYTVSRLADGALIVVDNAGNDGRDTLFNVNELQFKDESIIVQKVAPPVETDEKPWLANQTPNQVWKPGQAISWKLPAYAFVDSDPSESNNGQQPPMVFSATLANGKPLPSWLTFTPTTEDFAGGGVFTGTAPTDMTAVTIRVTATDAVSGKSASETFSILPVQQRMNKSDGSYAIYHADATGLPYSSFEDIFNAAKTQVAEARDYAGSGRLVLDTGGLTFSAAAGLDSLGSGEDVFAISPHPAESVLASGHEHERFDFSNHFGGATLVGFDASGTGHDVIQLEVSMFSYLTSSMTQAADIAAVLNHVIQNAGNTEIIDTTDDRIILDGVAKATLLSNAADFKFV